MDSCRNTKTGVQGVSVYQKDNRFYTDWRDRNDACLAIGCSFLFLHSLVLVSWNSF